MHVTSVVRPRFAPHTVPYGLMINELFEGQWPLNTLIALE